MADPEIKVKISVDDALSAAVDRISDKLNGLEKVTDRVGRGLKNFGDKVVRFGADVSKISAGVGVASAGILALAKSTATAGDDAVKTADKLGIGVEALQEIGYAAERSGVQQRTFEIGLQRVTRRMSEAAQGGGEAKDAIAELGLDAAALSAAGPEASLNAIADAMAKVESQSDRVRLGFKLFDSEGVGMINMLGAGSAGLDEMRQEARETGNVLSEDVARSSEEFNDAMLRLQERLAGLKNTVGAELIPVFVDTLIPMIEEKVIPAIAGMAEGIADAVSWFTGLPAPVQEAAAAIVGAFAIGGPVLVAIGFLSKALGLLTLTTGPIGLFIAAAALLTAAWVKWGDDITVAIQDGVAVVKEKFQGLVDWFKGLPETFLQIGRDIIEGLKDGILEKWENTKDKVKAPFVQLTGWVKSHFDTHSPSRVFHEIGTNLIEGMHNGIVGAAPMLGGAMDAISENVLGNLGTIFGETQKFAAAEALINAGRAAAQALADPKIPVFGKIAAAASMFAAGKKFADSIKSASPSGGGGSAAVPVAAQPQGSTNYISLVGDTFSRDSVESLLTETLQSEIDRGGRVIFS